MSLAVCDHARSAASNAFRSCSTLTDRAQAVVHDSPARARPSTHTDRCITPPYVPSGSLSLFFSGPNRIRCAAMTLLEICQAIQNTQIGTAMRESNYYWMLNGSH